MKYEYFTILTDGASEFTAAVNKKGRDGWKLLHFKYDEYSQNIKGEGPTIIQSYVGVMEREYNGTKGESEDRS